MQREREREPVRASVRRQVREGRGGCGADTWKRRETGWGEECILTRRNVMPSYAMSRDDVSRSGVKW